MGNCKNYVIFLSTKSSVENLMILTRYTIGCKTRPTIAILFILALVVHKKIIYVPLLIYKNKFLLKTVF